MNSKKAATFLQYSSVCGNKLFLKQDELLQHDNKKKEGIIVIPRLDFGQSGAEVVYNGNGNRSSINFWNKT